jgi:hypothetical protein
MCYERLDNLQDCLKDIAAAQLCMVTKAHEQIIRETGRKGLTKLVLFSVPQHLLFQVNPSKAKNLSKRQYLKDAEIIQLEQQRNIKVSTGKGHSRSSSTSSVGSSSSGGFYGFSGAALLSPLLARSPGTIIRSLTTKSASHRSSNQSLIALSDPSNSPKFHHKTLARSSSLMGRPRSASEPLRGKTTSAVNKRLPPKSLDLNFDKEEDAGHVRDFFVGSRFEKLAHIPKKI